MTISRDFKGVWIPKEIWLDHNLTATEKCILAEIHSLDNGEGCFASDKYLAEMFGSTAGSVSNVISSLKKRGYITRIKNDGRKRWLKVKCEQSSPMSESRNHAGVNDVPHSGVNIDISKESKEEKDCSSPLKSPDTGIAKRVPPQDNTCVTKSVGTEKPQDRSGEAKVKPKAKGVTWLTAYYNIYSDVFGGSMGDAKTFSRAFKKLETDYGRDATIAGWEKHCRQEGKYATPHYFARKPAMWIQQQQSSVSYVPENQEWE